MLKFHRCQLKTCKAEVCVFRENKSKIQGAQAIMFNAYNMARFVATFNPDSSKGGSGQCTISARCDRWCLSHKQGVRPRAHVPGDLSMTHP